VDATTFLKHDPCKTRKILTHVARSLVSEAERRGFLPETKTWYLDELGKETGPHRRFTFLA